MLPIRLIVGLGNIGKSYIGTRHNIGKILVQELAKFLNCSFHLEKKFIGYITQVYIHTSQVILLCPNTYMNNSGISVANIAQFYKFNTQEILVIHDELDLKCGYIRLKKFGGHSGHNGVRNIINHLGTKDFYRLRIGIGHPGDRQKVSNYVLNKPSNIDKLKIHTAFNQVISCINDIIKGNHEKVMNKLHRNFINVPKLLG